MAREVLAFLPEEDQRPDIRGSRSNSVTNIVLATTNVPVEAAWFVGLRNSLEESFRRYYCDRARIASAMPLPNVDSAHQLGSHFCFAKPPARYCPISASSVPKGCQVSGQSAAITAESSATPRELKSVVMVAFSGSRCESMTLLRNVPPRSFTSVTWVQIPSGTLTKSKISRDRLAVVQIWCEYHLLRKHKNRHLRQLSGRIQRSQ